MHFYYFFKKTNRNDAVVDSFADCFILIKKNVFLFGLGLARLTLLKNWGQWRAHARARVQGDSRGGDWSTGHQAARRADDQGGSSSERRGQVIRLTGRQRMNNEPEPVGIALARRPAGRFRAQC
jgi:hypothetical protein